jgi:hypothetical protein
LDTDIVVHLYKSGKKELYFLVEGVIPFAFYELLFLKYIKTDMTHEEMLYEFEEVNRGSI